MEPHPAKRTTVDDVRAIKTRERSWPTKSGGELEVLFALSRAELAAFLDESNPCFDDHDQDLRGLRSYRVSGLKKGARGAMEWHKMRTEFVFAIEGSARWTCVDLDGNEKVTVLDKHTAVMTPPMIMHTYEALEDGTTIQVVANTLFVPEDPATHDSYPRESFDGLMRET